MALTTQGGSECPVCGHGPMAPRMDLGDYHLYHCTACDSWTSDAAFHDADLSFVPEAYFENPDADRPNWEALHARRERDGRETARILDVGCGNGAYLGFVRERWPATERCGIEIDAGRAAEARVRDPEATILEGDAEGALDGAAGPYDLITLWDVYEHVPAPSRLLAKLADRLAPDGWIYLQTIHENSIVPFAGRLAYDLSGGRLRQPVRRTHDAHHLTFFSKSALLASAERAGLAVRERWWGRLTRERMDGPAWLTAATASVLWLENLLGNGLFIHLVLEPSSPAAGGSARTSAGTPGPASG